MLFSLLDLKMNDTYDGMNFAHLTFNVATLRCKNRNNENAYEY